MSNLTVSIYSPDFQRGYVEGLSGVKPDGCLFNLECPVTEDDVIAIVSNLTEIAEEGWLTEEQLRHDTGLLAGWISRAVYPSASNPQQPTKEQGQC